MIKAIDIAATPASPRVVFSPDTGYFAIEGDSFPENAIEFYGPILGVIHAYFDQAHSRPLDIHLRLTYLNSSSSKALLDLFERAELALAEGHEIRISWHYQEKDSDLRELGEDFALDFKLPFSFVPE